MTTPSRKLYDVLLQQGLPERYAQAAVKAVQEMIEEVVSELSLDSAVTNGCTLCGPQFIGDCPHGPPQESLEESPKAVNIPLGGHLPGPPGVSDDLLDAVDELKAAHRAMLEMLGRGVAYDPENFDAYSERQQAALHKVFAVADEVRVSMSDVDVEERHRRLGGPFRCDRCGNRTYGTREGTVDYCTSCGGELSTPVADTRGDK